MPECRHSSAGLLLLAARSVLSMWCDGRPRSGQSRVSYHDITKSTSFDDGDWFESFRGQSLFDSHSSLHTVFIRIRCCFQSRAFTSSFRSLGRVARIVFFSQTVFTRHSPRWRALRRRANRTSLQFVPAPSPSGWAFLSSATGAHQRAAVFVALFSLPVARPVPCSGRSCSLGRRKSTLRKQRRSRSGRQEESR